MKKLIIIAVAAVLVLSGAIAGVVAFLNTPERVTARALTGVLEDLGKREEIAPLGNVLTKGSIAFEVDSNTLNELIGEELNVEGKFYFSDKAMMLDALKVKVGDVKLTGGLYLDENRFYVENSEILGGAWGLERGKLESDWKDSVFAPKSGTEVALDEGTFDAISEILAALDEEMDKEMIKDLRKVTERYGKKAWDLFCEHAEFESENDSVRINKERKNARVITITLDGDAVATIMEDMVEYITEDDKLKDLVVKYGDRFADLLEEYAEIEDIDDTYDELMKQLEDSADEIVDNIEAVVSDDIVITVVTPTTSAKLLMLTVEYDDAEIVSVQFGHKGLAKTDNITVKVADTYEVSYKISENSKDEYKSSLEVMGEKVASLKINKDKESYELELVDLCKVKGKMSTKGNAHTITVDNIGIYETSWDGTSSISEEYKKLGITLIFNEKDKMPKAEDKVDSLLSLKEKDLEKWEKRMQDLGMIEGDLDMSDGDLDGIFNDGMYDDDFNDDLYGEATPMEGVYVNLIIRSYGTNVYTSYNVYSADGSLFTAIVNFCEINGLDWSFSSDVLYQIDNMYADYGSEWVAYYEDSYEKVKFVGEYLTDGETIVVELK